jgi:peroxiredoxin
MTKRLEINTPAPDLTLLNDEGQSVALNTFWGKAPTILTFLRHFG